MDPSNFHIKSVKVLQLSLKDKDVIVSDQRKTDLIELCENCIKITIEVDPDGLLDVGGEILKENCCCLMENICNNQKPFLV